MFVVCVSVCEHVVHLRSLIAQFARHVYSLVLIIHAVADTFLVCCTVVVVAAVADRLLLCTLLPGRLVTGQQVRADADLRRPTLE